MLSRVKEQKRGAKPTTAWRSEKQKTYSTDPSCRHT